MKLFLALMLLALIGCSDRSPAVTGATAAGGSTCASAGPVRLDDAKVPPQFKDLVPLARKWGIGDDSARSTCVAESSASDRHALATALGGRTAEVHRWLDEVKPGEALTNEQAAFLYMLNALEILDASQSTPEQGK